MSFNDPIDRIRKKIHTVAFDVPKYRDNKIEALLKQLLSYHERVAEAMNDMLSKEEQKVGLTCLINSDFTHYVSRNCPKSATFAMPLLRSDLDDWRQWYRSISWIIRSTQYIQGDQAPQDVFEDSGTWAAVVKFIFEKLRALKFGDLNCVHQLVQESEFASVYWRCRIYDELKDIEHIGGLGGEWLHGYQEALEEREKLATKELEEGEELKETEVPSEGKPTQRTPVKRKKFKETEVPSEEKPTQRTPAKRKKTPTK